MAQFALDGFAIITGAASGIGKGVGLTFAEAGAAGIIFADINGDGATRAAEESNEIAAHPSYRAIGAQIDVTNAASIQKVVDLAVKEFGRIDYLVNSAGVDVAEYVPITETNEDDYERVMAVNTKGTFLMIKAVAKVMQGQAPRTVNLKRVGERSIGRGSIVNVASAAALAAVPGKVAYISSKHAVLGVTRTAAIDLNKDGIRVNMVSPTWVRTAMFEEECRRVPAVPEMVKKLFPLGRPLEPDEVGSAAQYLCSPSAVYITGTSIALDGGLLAGPSFS
ncbi:NAD(P)-binding protein [Polyplosphaeria fusca]|uniref:NAD(P)-binding protein n=1 Tax=Polyplosphaeria fusca TaxID=682080 RepID=A0A9P4QQS3_9PLEO|nr:NAD(P)-binding protein [Polyplosphaeria fusca]